MKNFIFYIFSFLFFITTTTWADYVSVNPRPRLKGMGGAGVSTRGDDESAMLNPAALADATRTRFQIFPLLFEVPFNIDLMNSFLDYNDVQGNKSKTDDQKRAALENFLQDVGSTSLLTRINFYPSYTGRIKSFGVHMGLLADVVVKGDMRVGGLSSNQIVELGDSGGLAGLILGFGYGFGDKRRSQVGVTVKPLYRIAVTANDTQTLFDFIKGQNNNASIVDEIFGKSKLQGGFGVGVDAGARVTLPIAGVVEQFWPSFGFTWQDIGRTRFTGSNNRPSDIEQSLSFGMSIHPDWRGLSNTVAFDFRNIFEEQEGSNKYHFGFESVAWDILALRFGLSQFYWTAGLGIYFRLLEMDLYVAAQEAARRAHVQEVRTLGLRLASAF